MLTVKYSYILLINVQAHYSDYIIVQETVVANVRQYTVCHNFNVMYLLYQSRMNLDIEAVRTTVIPSLQCSSCVCILNLLYHLSAAALL